MICCRTSPASSTICVRDVASICRRRARRRGSGRASCVSHSRRHWFRGHRPAAWRSPGTIDKPLGNCFALLPVGHWKKPGTTNLAIERPRPAPVFERKAANSAVQTSPERQAFSAWPRGIPIATPEESSDSGTEPRHTCRYRARPRRLRCREDRNGRPPFRPFARHELRGHRTNSAGRKDERHLTIPGAVHSGGN